MTELSPLEREAAHLIALGSLPVVGPATLLRCHREGGAPAAWSAVLRGRARTHPALAELFAHLPGAAAERASAVARTIDPAAELDRQVQGGRMVLVFGEEDYPARLLDDPAPPVLLFAQGDLRLLDGPTVAIVGTRNATRPGRDLACRLGGELAGAGVSVVSGLALGIDGAAHRGVLNLLGSDGTGPRAEPDDGALPGLAEPAVEPGRPVGVIASGLDIAYPRRHVGLHAEVAAVGLLVSETPLGQRPLAWRFPARNRIIAGLADAVVVVESRSAGGSMLTAGEALDRGVPVLAVPGHPTAPAAAGTNDLIFDGAPLVRSVDDILEAIGLTRLVVSSRRPSAERLGREHRLVLEVIGEAPCGLEQVVARCGLSLEQTATVLTELETTGRVVRTAGWYERSADGPSSTRGRTR